jgi:CHAD domain-containing protein
MQNRANGRQLWPVSTLLQPHDHAELYESTERYEFIAGVASDSGVTLHCARTCSPAFIFDLDNAVMRTSEHLEIETKLDVDPALVMPDLTGLPGVVGVEGPSEQQLDATYFDTADLALAAARVTLRRRTGGDDAGWHLKLPLGGQARREVRAPLAERAASDDDAEGVPEALSDAVRVLVRDRDLHPIATLRTRRLVHRLMGENAVVLAEVADDLVTAAVPGEAVRVDTWREWEVELVDGSTELLDAAGGTLMEAGASVSKSASKLRRALGPAAPPLTPAAFDLPARPSAVEVLVTYLHNRIADVTRLDPAFRADEPEALHDLRVAVRRLRSALATYKTLLEDGAVEQLRAELKWLGTTLGGPRDAEVLRTELAKAVAAEPADLVLGFVAVRIDDDLSTTYQHGRRTALAALDGIRYFRLLDQLDALVSAPPVSDLGGKPALKVIPRLVAKDWRRLRRLTRRAETVIEDADRGRALHEVRKAAKRLRYGAEAAHPLIGRKASRLAAAAKNVQTILGDHHDTVVIRDVLRRLAVEAQLAGDSSFTYGRLHALAQVKAAKADARYRNAWDGFAAPRIARWTKA